MDVFGQFRDGMLSLFNGNTYLSSGVAAQLFPDDDETITEEDHLKKINSRLNSAGVAGTLEQLDIDRMEGDRFVCKGILVWEINKTKNLSATGTQKPGRLILQESLSIMRRHVVPVLNDALQEVDCFSGILINWGKRLGQENGLEIWAIEYETKMAI